MHDETVKEEMDMWVDQRILNCIFRLIVLDYVLYRKKYSILTSLIFFFVFHFFLLFVNKIINYKVHCK